MAALHAHVFAQGDAAYEGYMGRGKAALAAHDDEEALRYFTLASLLEPSSAEAARYIDDLKARGTSVRGLDASQQADSYRRYLARGLAAYNKGQHAQAVHFFTVALSFDPDGKEADQYLQLLSQGKALPMAAPTTSPASAPTPVATSNPGASYTPSQQPPAAQAPAAHAPLSPPSQPVAGKTAPYVLKKKGPILVIGINEILSNPANKATIRVELGSSVIVEGNNIQRFLIVEEGFIGVKTIGRNQVQIDAFKRGSTFVHLWDDNGRSTIFVEVVFPTSTVSNDRQSGPIEHALPFRFSYANDWNAYFYKTKGSTLERQSLDFQQNFALLGDTPYGLFDTSMTVSQFNGPPEIVTYTVGLTNIPAPGTTNLSLRAFDALRFTTPLTMPGIRLRGIFADANVLNDMLGVSLSHGQKLSTYGFISPGSSLDRQSYIDAAKLTLFPKSNEGQMAFTFARDYGDEREPYLTKQVYSVEGWRRLTEHTTVNGELARDDAHTAKIAGIRWDNGQARTALNFRDLHEDFTTVSALPANQGEIGGTWTTSAAFERYSIDTMVDVYRDRLYYNPDHQEALNYDNSARLHVALTPELSAETNAYYVYNPGELSPRRSVSLDERLSRYFDIWGERKATVYVGGSYQRSRYALTSTSDYDRYAVVMGISVPVTREVSAFANYEYSWLYEPVSGIDSNPNVFNTGIIYNKQITPKTGFNARVTYRNEEGVQGLNSFLAGEDSIGVSTGISYQATPDMNIFADAGARKIWAQRSGSQSYNDLNVHIGVRMVFDVFPGWDPKGTVSGFVFKDKDGNGKMDPGEPGLEGIKVKVGDKEAVTGPDGRFKLAIRAKRAVVSPVAETIPAGLVFSTPTFAKVDIVQGRTVRIDFGVMGQTAIYGIVFVDQNGNGKPDDGDQFIGKVRLTLDGKTRQVSDNRGAYFFRNIAEGPHRVSVDLESLPLNMIPLVKLSNDINVAEGSTYVLHVPLKVKEAVDDGE